MNYIKSLFFNFFIVFFADYLIPGIDVVNQSKLPHIGGDLIFAFALGLLNSLIVPLFRLMDHHVSMLRVTVVTFILNFGAYALLKLLPLGIFITNIEGYLIAAFVVSIACSILNYLEVRRQTQKMAPSRHDEFHDHE